MRRLRLSLVLACCAALATLVGSARSAEAQNLAPLGLPAGQAQLELGFTLNLSEDNVGDPITFEPGFYIGAIDKLAIGVITDPFPYLGLIPLGLCIGDNCDLPIKSFGPDIVYDLVGGENWRLGLHGGVDFFLFEDAFGDTDMNIFVRIGVLARYFAGQFLLETDTSLSIGDDVILRLPIIPQFLVTPSVALGIPFTIVAGDGTSVGLGFQGRFALTPQFDLGILFSFPDLDVTEFRTFCLSLTYRP